MDVLELGGFDFGVDDGDDDGDVEYDGDTTDQYDEQNDPDGGRVFHVGEVTGGVGRPSTRFSHPEKVCHCQEVREMQESGLPLRK